MDKSIRHHTDPVLKHWGLKNGDQQYAVGGCNRTDSDWTGVVNGVCTWKDVTGQFREDNDSLVAVSIRKSYPIPRMDGCIEYLGDATNILHREL